MTLLDELDRFSLEQKRAVTLPLLRACWPPGKTQFHRRKPDFSTNYLEQLLNTL